LKHLAIALLGLLLATPAAAERPSDTLLIGRIYPTALTTVPVAALAYDRDGRVLAHGSSQDVRKLLEARKGVVNEIVVAGSVIPGLIDAHGHMLNLGFSLLQADLVGTRSKADVIERLRAKVDALAPGEWLLGRGWDQNDWQEQQFPSAADLDHAFPDRPVWLERVDGHAGWANSMALRAAKLAADTPDPAGGRIERGANGAPTGVFVDTAMDLVQRQVPKPSADLSRRALRLALQSAVAAGLTGVHDAGVSRDDLALYRELADDDALPLRVYAMADGDGAALDWLCRKGAYAHPGGRLGMRAVKLYADGALGSRGAALLADYADDPGNRGLMIETPEKLAQSIARAAGCGVQPAVHAIGDRANRATLDAYAALSAEQRTRLRPRIEHAQVIDLPDIPRFG